MIVLAERSHKRGGAVFEVPNIEDSVVYKTEAVVWDLVLTKSELQFQSIEKI